MAESHSAEIMCPKCRRKTLVLRKPKFDGFTRVGDELKCSECGTVFEDESQLEFVESKKPDIFTEDEKPKKIDLFEGDEVRICRYCKQYTVNPFTQRCILHNREVEATDSCDRFERRTDDKGTRGEESAKGE